MLSASGLESNSYRNYNKTNENKSANKLYQFSIGSMPLVLDRNTEQCRHMFACLYLRIVKTSQKGAQNNKRFNFLKVT
jgi:hypothetical protein